MSQQKYIQEENILMVIAVGLFCLALIWWTYDRNKKRDSDLKKMNKAPNSYTKSFSWRLYIIAGSGFLIMIFELVNRFMKLFS